jgi:teichuronic acid biosynthesis protein TuaE
MVPTQVYVIEARNTSTLLSVLWYVVIVLAFVGGNVVIHRLGEFHIIPFRVLLFFYWVLFLIVMLRRGEKLWFPINAVEIKLYILFYVLWVFYALLSFLWAVSKTDCLRHCFFLLIGLSIILLTLYNFNSAQRLNSLYIFWIIMVICLIGVGVWENLSSHHLPNSHVLPQYGFIHPLLMRIPSGVYTNPNDYATFLCLTAPFSYTLLRYSRNIFYKAAGGLLIVIAIYFIIYTSSRANMIAFLLESGVVFLLAIKNKNYRFLRRAFLLIIVAVVIFFFMARLSNIFIGKYLRKLPTEFHNLITGDESIHARKNLIRNGYVFLKDSAFFGVGAGNNEWYQGHMGVYGTLGITSMHNWWMELMVDYGVIIFLLYCALYLSLLRELYKATKSEVSIIGISAESLFISLVGFSIASISSSSIFGDRTIWFLFATAITIVNLYKRERAST